MVSWKQEQVRRLKPSCLLGEQEQTQISVVPQICWPRFAQHPAKLIAVLFTIPPCPQNSMLNCKARTRNIKNKSRRIQHWIWGQGGRSSETSHRQELHLSFAGGGYLFETNFSICSMCDAILRIAFRDKFPKGSRCIVLITWRKRVVKGMCFQRLHSFSLLLTWTCLST